MKMFCLILFFVDLAVSFSAIRESRILSMQGLVSYEHPDGACEVFTSFNEFDDSYEWPVAARGVFFADEYEAVDTKLRSLVHLFLA